MFALEVLVGLAILVGVAFLASREVPTLDDADPDRPDVGLPAHRPLRSEDVGQLRLRVVAGIRGIRGYRFDDVDATLRKVEETLRFHELAAAQHSGAVPSAPAPPPSPRPDVGEPPAPLS